MLHVTCDLCGKEIRPNEDQHFVVRMEVFSAGEPTVLTEADLDQDNIEAVGQMLTAMTEDHVVDPFPPASQHIRFDLCTDCRQKFLRDPLGKEAAQKFDFSEN